MNDVILNLVPAFPEIFVMTMACAILLVGLFLPQRQLLVHWLAQITLIIVAILTIHGYLALNITTPLVIYYNNFVLDKLAVFLKEVIYISVFLTFAYSARYNALHRMPSLEFYVLGLLSMLGMMVLVSAHSLLTLFLGMELMSLPIYAMVAFARAKERCVEAAMKYFVIGALATGLLLYGMSILFGLTKSLDIGQIAIALGQMPPTQTAILVIALVFLIAGIAFKFGAAPFHMWVPDVYDGAPNSITLFLSTAPKVAAFALAIRLLVEGMPSLAVQWSHILIVVSILSIAVGNLAAIVQTNIKRMLGYSSIAHMGYMLLGLACATPRGYAAAMFYSITYTVMTLTAFGMIVLMSYEGFEASEIDDFAGLNNTNPWLAFLMLIVMFAMAGIPPLVGFIAKLGIIEALIQVQLTWLAVYAVVFAIIGSYYYIYVVKVMYFGDTPTTNKKFVYSLGQNIAISINGLAVLVLGILPGALFALCHFTFFV